MLKGADTKEVIGLVEEQIAAIQKTLPRDVRIVPVYDQADLVSHAVKTVTDSLLVSVLLIVIVLFLFLWNSGRRSSSSFPSRCPCLSPS